MMGFQCFAYGKTLRAIPVLDAGRYKPFDTFARETFQLIHGKKSDEGTPVEHIILTWFLVPQYWLNVEFVQISNYKVKEALGVSPQKRFFSFNQIRKSENLSHLLKDLSLLKERGESLNPFYQAIQSLESQITLFVAITQGRYPLIAPTETPGEWVSFAQSDEELKKAFQKIINEFVRSLVKEGLSQESIREKMVESEAKESPTQSDRELKRVFKGIINEFIRPLGKDSSSRESIENQMVESEAMESAVDEFITLARSRNPDDYPLQRRIDVEIFYNMFQPFLWSAVAYILSVIFFFIGFFRRCRWGLWALSVAFALHTFGFILRVYIAERPPVSNMFESVIWVSWGAVLLCFIFEYFKKTKFMLFSAAIVSSLSLIAANMAPIVLDPSLQPLTPALRSHFWLIVHVLTITLSYSAFFVAFIMGDIGLVFFIKGEKKYKKQIAVLQESIYRCLQVGVILLSVGTILGGVWADYAWGRFWGWDPKEAWALIALLGYIAVLHGRLSGWLRSFGFIASAVVTFSLVIMAWYGVNFVLGVGLHSYGFGAGGVEYVSLFVILHFLFVIVAAAMRRLSSSA